MKRKFNFKRGLPMTLLLSAVILFSQCQKDGTEDLVPASDAFAASSISAVSSTTNTAIALDASTSVSDGGYAYVIYKDFGISGDSDSDPSVSTLKVYEDGVEIGPAHSVHDDIRGQGKGRFSHWGNKLYFSASDNSNPKTNGRKYTFSIGTLSTSGSGTTTNATPIPLDISSATLDAGYAYRLSKDFGIAGDSPSAPEASTLRIFENGVELNPAHSVHADIRNTGKGRFSHWGSKLYFSSSDNTDPRKNGRKYSYLIGGTSAPAPAPESPTDSPVSSTTGPIGFANVNGSTTGGKGGQTVTVSSLSALKSAAESSSPMIIKVSGAISGTGSIGVKSNKSIIGLSGASITGVSLHVMNVSNVIIQNLKLSKVVGDDCINIKYANHIWIDHCDLSADRNHGWDYYDGLLDITRESDFITVSNNTLHDTFIALLIGADDANTADKGKLNVTIYKNYFYNIAERQPRIRFGYVHSFNNYFKSSSGYAIASCMGAVVRTDNNYFESVNIPIRTVITGSAGYVSGANTNVYKSSGSNMITTAASSWVPTYEYRSILIPAADVASKIPATAGATL